MAAPIKNVLNYYNWECNAYDIGGPLEDLSEDYGPLGETIYRRMLDLVYSNGFYYEASIEKVSKTITKKIGKNWVKTPKCEEILTYCVEIGLFDKNLVQRNIWTSTGIQKRYFEIMVKLRRTIKIENLNYLLYEDVLTAPTSRVIATETGVIVTITGVNVAITQVNADKRKEKEIKLNQIKEKDILDELLGQLNIVFKEYLGRLKGEDMIKIQTNLKEFSFNEILESVEVAKRNDVKNIDYVIGILKKKG